MLWKVRLQCSLTVSCNICPPTDKWFEIEIIIAKTEFTMHHFRRNRNFAWWQGRDIHNITSFEPLSSVPNPEKTNAHWSWALYSILMKPKGRLPKPARVICPPTLVLQEDGAFWVPLKRQTTFESLQNVEMQHLFRKMELRMTKRSTKGLPRLEACGDAIHLKMTWLQRYGLHQQTVRQTPTSDLNSFLKLPDGLRAIHQKQ